MHVGRDAQNKFATTGAERDTVEVVLVLGNERGKSHGQTVHVRCSSSLLIPPQHFYSYTLPVAHSCTPKHQALQREEALGLGWAEVEQRHVFLSWRCLTRDAMPENAFR
jgi:hypothetical protein